MKKGKKYPPQPLTVDEVRRLIAATSRRALTGQRSRAMIAILWRAGLRISELLALAPWDLERTDRGLRIHVRHGKGDKSRVVAMSGAMLEYVDAWRATHEAMFRGSPILFCPVRGAEHNKPITARGFRQTLDRLAKSAKVHKRVHAHGLRHTFALELDDERLPLRVIQGALGHGNARTTSTYLSSLGADEVTDALEQRAESPGRRHNDASRRV
jgi:site-specific recombinase XerD